MLGQPIEYLATNPVLQEDTRMVVVTIRMGDWRPVNLILTADQAMRLKEDLNRSLAGATATPLAQKVKDRKNGG